MLSLNLIYIKKKTITYYNFSKQLEIKNKNCNIYSLIIDLNVLIKYTQPFILTKLFIL